ncbi:MAG: HEAT repeat domain-containing protein, partial [Planctomycetes bacterium]|nr:HEAT repeat domain-containing protein [Planctomycetota bacterium]
MNRLGICACWLAALGAPAPFVSAQSETTTEADTTNHLEQLANCRDGIVDTQARPEGRRRWINTLLAFDTPEARQLIVELLKLSTSPEAQRAICEVIAHDARSAPGRLSPSFIDPLLLLLDTDDERLRLGAVRALANFPGEEVSAKLRTLASESNAPMRRRLAAIDALASKVNQREVVGELIILLDADVPQITARVLQALEPLANERLGTDVDRWRAWWADKSKLSEEAWLAGQLHLYEERLQTLSEEFHTFRTNAEHQHAAITARLGEFQRDVFRALSNEEREGRLTAWLDDPLPEVQQTALAIIKAQIADEGRRPAGEALAALLRLLRNGSPPVRRDVLQIVQTLSDPAVVTTVLDQLQVEEDLAIRPAILKAIGKLNRAEGVPALVAEIGAPTSAAECIR